MQRFKDSLVTGNRPNKQESLVIDKNGEYVKEAIELIQLVREEAHEEFARHV